MICLGHSLSWSLSVPSCLSEGHSLRPRQTRQGQVGGAPHEVFGGRDVEAKPNEQSLYLRRREGFDAFFSRVETGWLTIDLRMVPALTMSRGFDAPKNEKKRPVRDRPLLELL